MALLIWISRSPRDLLISIFGCAVLGCLTGVLKEKIPITAYVMRFAIISLIQFQHRHRTPLQFQNEEYEVDPILDLIPVCPNCHMVLHSKKDGVYTPEEVIEFLHSQN